MQLTDHTLIALDLMSEIELNFSPLVFANEEDDGGELALRFTYVGWITTWNTLFAIVYSVILLVVSIFAFFIYLALFAEDLNTLGWYGPILKYNLIVAVSTVVIFVLLLIGQFFGYKLWMWASSYFYNLFDSNLEKLIFWLLIGVVVPSILTVGAFALLYFFWYVYFVNV